MNKFSLTQRAVSFILLFTFFSTSTAGYSDGISFSKPLSIDSPAMTRPLPAAMSVKVRTELRELLNLPPENLPKYLQSNLTALRSELRAEEKRETRKEKKRRDREKIKKTALEQSARRLTRRLWLIAGVGVLGTAVALPFLLNSQGVAEEKIQAAKTLFSFYGAHISDADAKEAIRYFEQVYSKNTSKHFTLLMENVPNLESMASAIKKENPELALLNQFEFVLKAKEKLRSHYEEKMVGQKKNRYNALEDFIRDTEYLALFDSDHARFRSIFIDFAKRNQIQMVYEEPDFEAWYADLLSQEYERMARNAFLRADQKAFLELYKEAKIRLVAANLARDQALNRLIQEMFEENPDQAILLFRGIRHHANHATISTGSFIAKEPATGSQARISVDADLQSRLAAKEDVPDLILLEAFLETYLRNAAFQLGELSSRTRERIHPILERIRAREDSFELIFDYMKTRAKVMDTLDNHIKALFRELNRLGFITQKELRFLTRSELRQAEKNRNMEPTRRAVIKWAVAGGILSTLSLGFAAAMGHFGWFRSKKWYEEPLQNSLEGMKAVFQRAGNLLRDQHYPRMDVIQDYLNALKTAKAGDPQILGEIPYGKARLQDGSIEIWINLNTAHKHFRAVWTTKSDSFFVEQIAAGLIQEAWGYKLFSISKDASEAFNSGYELLIQKMEAATKRGESNVVAFLMDNQSLIHKLIAYLLAGEFFEIQKRADYLKWAEQNHLYLPAKVKEDLKPFQNEDLIRSLQLNHALNFGNSRYSEEQLTSVLSSILTSWVRAFFQNGRSRNNFLFALFFQMETSRYRKTEGREGIDPKVENWMKAKRLPPNEIYRSVIGELKGEILRLVWEWDERSHRSELRSPRFGMPGMLIGFALAGIPGCIQTDALHPLIPLSDQQQIDKINEVRSWGASRTITVYGNKIKVYDNYPDGQEEFRFTDEEVSIIENALNELPRTKVKARSVMAVPYEYAPFVNALGVSANDIIILFMLPADFKIPNTKETSRVILGRDFLIENSTAFNSPDQLKAAATNFNISLTVSHENEHIDDENVEIWKNLHRKSGLDLDHYARRYSVTLWEEDKSTMNEVWVNDSYANLSKGIQLSNRGKPIFLEKLLLMASTFVISERLQLRTYGAVMNDRLQPEDWQARVSEDGRTIDIGPLRLVLNDENKIESVFLAPSQPTESGVYDFDHSEVSELKEAIDSPLVNTILIFNEALSHLPVSPSSLVTGRSELRSKVNFSPRLERAMKLFPLDPSLSGKELEMAQIGQEELARSLLGTLADDVRNDPAFVKRLSRLRRDQRKRDVRDGVRRQLFELGREFLLANMQLEFSYGRFAQDKRLLSEAQRKVALRALQSRRLVMARAKRVYRALKAMFDQAASMNAMELKKVIPRAKRLLARFEKWSQSRLQAEQEFFDIVFASNGDLMRSLFPKRSELRNEDKQGFGHMTFAGLAYELILNAPEDEIGILNAEKGLNGWANSLFLSPAKNVWYAIEAVDMRTRFSLSERLNRDMGKIVALIFYLTKQQMDEAKIESRDSGEPVASGRIPLAWATPFSKNQYLTKALEYLKEVNYPIDDEVKRRFAKALGYEKVYQAEGWELFLEKLGQDAAKEQETFEIDWDRVGYIRVFGSAEEQELIEKLFLGTGLVWFGDRMRMEGFRENGLKLLVTPGDHYRKNQASMRMLDQIWRGDGTFQDFHFWVNQGKWKRIVETVFSEELIKNQRHLQLEKEAYLKLIERITHSVRSARSELRVETILPETLKVIPLDELPSYLNEAQIAKDDVEIRKVYMYGANFLSEEALAVLENPLNARWYQDIENLKDGTVPVTPKILTEIIAYYRGGGKSQDFKISSGYSRPDVFNGMQNLALLLGWHWAGLTPEISERLRQIFPSPHEPYMKGLGERDMTKEAIIDFLDAIKKDRAMLDGFLKVMQKASEIAVEHSAYRNNFFDRQEKSNLGYAGAGDEHEYQYMSTLVNELFKDPAFRVYSETYFPMKDDSDFTRFIFRFFPGELIKAESEGMDPEIFVRQNFFGNQFVRKDHFDGKLNKWYFTKWQIDYFYLVLSAAHSQKIVFAEKLWKHFREKLLQLEKYQMLVIQEKKSDARSELRNIETIQFSNRISALAKHGFQKLSEAQFESLVEIRKIAEEILTQAKKKNDLLDFEKLGSELLEALTQNASPSQLLNLHAVLYKLFPVEEKSKLITDASSVEETTEILRSAAQILRKQSEQTVRELSRPNRRWFLGMVAAIATHVWTGGVENAALVGLGQKPLRVDTAPNLIAMVAEKLRERWNNEIFSVDGKLPDFKDILVIRLAEPSFKRFNIAEAVRQNLSDVNLIWFLSKPDDRTLLSAQKQLQKSIQDAQIFLDDISDLSDPFFRGLALKFKAQPNLWEPTAEEQKQEMHALNFRRGISRLEWFQEIEEKGLDVIKRIVKLVAALPSDVIQNYDLVEVESAGEKDTHKVFDDLSQKLLNELNQKSGDLQDLKAIQRFEWEGGRVGTPEEHQKRDEHILKLQGELAQLQSNIQELASLSNEPGQMTRSELRRSVSKQIQIKKATVLFPKAVNEIGFAAKEIVDAIGNDQTVIFFAETLGDIRAMQELIRGVPGSQNVRFVSTREDVWRELVSLKINSAHFVAMKDSSDGHSIDILTQMLEDEKMDILLNEESDPQRILDIFGIVMEASEAWKQSVQFAKSA